MKYRTVVNLVVDTDEPILEVDEVLDIVKNKERGKIWEVEMVAEHAGRLVRHHEYRTYGG